MALTENSFTAAELEAAVTANPALVTELQNGFKTLGHVIPTAEHAAFIEKERGLISAAKTSEIYTALDKDILEASGEAKLNADEKTFAYAKRVLGKNKADVIAATAKVKDLEGKIAAGSTDPVIKQQLQAATDKLKKLEEEDVPGFQKQLFAKDVRLEVALALKNLTIKKDLPQNLVDIAINQATEKLTGMAKADAAGKIYYVDADGKPLLEGVTPATAEGLLKAELKDLLEGGHKGTGAETKPAPGSAKETAIKNPAGVLVTIPGDLKTKVELHDFLCKQGLTEGSEDFNKLYEEHGKDLKLR